MKKFNVNKQTIVVGSSACFGVVSNIQKRKWLYISRVNPAATEKDILEVLKHNQVFTEEMKFVKIVSANHKKYANIRIYVNLTDVPNTMISTFWPSGVGFREYVWFEKSDAAKKIAVKDKLIIQNGESKTSNVKM